MIKNTQNKKEISKNESMFSEQYIHKKNIIQNQLQAGYMQSNEPKTIRREEGSRK